MSIVIFWLESQRDSAPVSNHKKFTDKELMASLDLCRELEGKPGVTHIVSKGEIDGMVGKSGVSSIVDGKTPDGNDYEWSKAGRAGRFKESDTRKTHLKADQQ